MLRKARRIVGPIVALVIALTSVSAAIARGETMEGRHIVICSGGTLVSIILDADGKPVKRTQICPDYALTILASVMPAPIVALRPATSTTLVAPTSFLFPHSRQAPTPRARAPPLSA